MASTQGPLYFVVDLNCPAFEGLKPRAKKWGFRERSPVMMGFLVLDHFKRFVVLVTVDGVNGVGVQYPMCKLVGRGNRNKHTCNNLFDIKCLHKRYQNLVSLLDVPCSTELRQEVSGSSLHDRKSSF